MYDTDVTLLCLISKQATWIQCFVCPRPAEKGRVASALCTYTRSIAPLAGWVLRLMYMCMYVCMLHV